MAWRYVHLTGCAHADRIRVPVFGGEAEIIRMLPAADPKGYLLAVHGFGCNRVYPNRPIYQMFLDRGLGVLSVPLPGHHPAAPPFAAPWLGQYLPIIAKAVTPKLAAPIVAAQGNSWGAILALSAMPEIGSIRLGVFLEPPLRVEIGYGGLGREILSSFNRHLLPSATIPVRVIWDMARGSCRFLDRDGRETRWNFLHPRTLPELQRLLDHLQLPNRLNGLRGRQVMLIGGEQDRVSPPQDVLRLASYIPGETHVEIVPQANHTTLFFHPATMPLIETWLDRYLDLALEPVSPAGLAAGLADPLPGRP